MKKKESFDFLLFASTKGERWGKFVFSLPDFEIRNGKEFGWALDFTFDYDLMMNYNFFGIGPNSLYSNKEYFSYEPLNINVALSRSINKEFYFCFGLRYLTVSNYNFEANSALYNILPEINMGRVNSASYFINLSWDRRDSYIHPTKGTFLKLEAEHTPNTSLSNVSFLREEISFMVFKSIEELNSILAYRLKFENLSGNDLPIQILRPIGGNRTLRGFPQGRFLGNTAIVMNLEARTPVWWKFGAIIGADAGKVWESTSKIDLTKWAFSPAVGLRFYYDNFIVRLDAGFSHETFGLYFNINHIF